MSKILGQIEHVIVVKLENRSFDNMCGWLYGGDQGIPKAFLPSEKNDPYEGLNNNLFNPVDPAYFDGKQVELYPVFPHANATDIPNPDPMEDYSNVNCQLFGPEAPSQNPRWGNLGFVINYKKPTGANIPVQIMEPFSPDQGSRDLRSGEELCNM